jgi:endogenous inhibitor of DNA gyrase (YacG/DUF329 family)
MVMSRLSVKKDEERQEKRRCPHCGKIFVLTRKNKLFCSDSCRVKNFLRNQKLRNETIINDLKEQLRKYEEAAMPKVEEVVVEQKPKRIRTPKTKVAAS